MSYVLGLDAGGGRTRAALCRRTANGWSPPALVPLGDRSAAMPTVLYLAADGSVVVGEDAQRRAGAEPDRIARGFTRRVGDDVPLVLRGEPCAAHELTAVLVRGVVDLVEHEEGEPPEHLVLTHRPGWGAHRTGVLRDALAGQGLADVTLLPEPVAAAESALDCAPGDTAGVCDLGAHGASVAVLRRTATAFDLLAHAECAEQTGGDDFDAALFDLVRAALGREFDALDPADRQVWPALVGLRARCTEAKEALSSHAEVTLPVGLPGLPVEVTVSRTEFEHALRPGVRVATDALLAAVHASGVRPEELSALLAVGGSARVPLVATSLATAFSTTVVTCLDQEAAVALGAASVACQVLTGPVATLPALVERTEIIPALALMPFDELDGETSESPERPPIEITPLDLPVPRSLRQLMPGVPPAVLTTLALVLVAVGVVLTLVFKPGMSTAHPAPNPLQTTTVNQPAAPAGH